MAKEPSFREMLLDEDLTTPGIQKDPKMQAAATTAGVSAAGGATIGAIVGAAAGGPVGAVVGAAIGGATGGMTGGLLVDTGEAEPTADAHGADVDTGMIGLQTSPGGETERA